MAPVVGQQRGFTLIELLVSTTILAAVLYTAAFAYSLFAGAWDKGSSDFDKAFREARVKFLMQRVLSDIRPFLAQDARGRQGLYFEGDVQGFVGVSSRSLNYPKVPAVVRLSARQEEDFTLTLIYEEAPLLNKFTLEFGEVLEFNSPIEVESGLSEITFKYFGIAQGDGVGGSADNFISPEPRWLGSYNAYLSNKQPLAIQVEWRHFGGAQYGFIVDVEPDTGALYIRSDYDGF
jgi:prepilin-type N-terminal cleavage/methylation domain-containing protein